jgi:hypothetical protein
MSASRTTTTGDATRRVHAPLEHVLLEHYGRQNRTLLVWFACCFVTAAIVAAWAMIARPDELWLSPPILAVGVPAVVGAVVSDVLLAMSRRQHLLASLRAGIPIRRVQRNAYAIHVELADGRVNTLQGPDVKQLERIEELLHIQMEVAR